MPSPYWYIYLPEQQSSVQPVCCEPYLQSVRNEPGDKTAFLGVPTTSKHHVIGSSRRYKVLQMLIFVVRCQCVTQLILDQSWVFNSKIAIDKIELHSRGLISNQHKLRSRILLEKDSQQGLASSAIPASSGSWNETQNTSHRRFTDK